MPQILPHLLPQDPRPRAPCGAVSGSPMLRAADPLQCAVVCIHWMPTAVLGSVSVPGQSGWPWRFREEP